MDRWYAWRVATLQIYYYMPDHNSLIQEFVWQTEDYVPEFPKVHKLLWHWKHNIEATIQEVSLCYMDSYKKPMYVNCSKIFNA